MAKKRDYRAEYARRNALAKERGFSSYSQQRRAIETGKTRAIQPNRLRSKKTIEAQLALTPVFGGKSVKDWRIESAVGWSERNARTNRMKFDPVRARNDDAYLDAYTKVTVLQIAPKGEDESTLVAGDDLRHLLVDILNIMDDKEYDSRYGDKAH